jgi:hypothetical protein
MKLIELIDMKAVEMETNFPNFNQKIKNESLETQGSIRLSNQSF